MIDAKEKGRDPFSAIQTVVPWEVFTTSVREAEQLAREEDFDSIGLIVEHYGQLRRYAPTFLEVLNSERRPPLEKSLTAVSLSLP